MAVLKGLKTWALPHLVCPQCKSKLIPEPFEKDDQEGIITGIMTCSNDDCSTWYPVIRGIPRLLPVHLRADVTNEFIHTYRDKMNSLGTLQKLDSDSQEPSTITDIKHQTIKNFGFEWTKYDRFGWDDPVYNIEKEETAFKRKAILDKDEIKEKLVLDAGCGNGRYLHWAAHYGAMVIGVELGNAVESAARNTAELPNVQIIQGDIFSLPFPLKQFDAIFSVGVLMLTGDAKKATLSLAEHVKEGGTLTAHVYGKGNLIYELMDYLLRSRTTRMSIPRLEQFTDRAFRLRRRLDRWGLTDFITRFVRLDDHPHCIFDWYSAPTATHHTYEEVIGWLKEGGLQIAEIRKKQGISSSIRGKLSRYLSKPPSSVTVKGIRNI